MNNSLYQCQQEVEKNINWSGANYFYNGSVSAITKLYDEFLKENNIQQLKSTLKFLLCIKGKSLFHLANAEIEDGFYKALSYYAMELQILYSNSFMQDSILAQMAGEKAKELTHALNGSSVEKLLDALLPNVATIEQFQNGHDLFNNIVANEPQRFNELNTYCQNCSDVVTDKIINILNNIVLKYHYDVNAHLDALWNLNYYQTFISEIIFSDERKTIAAMSKINEMFAKHLSDYEWLERQGVLTCRFFNILTPEMSDIFNACLDDYQGEIQRIYAEFIFNGLIKHILLLVMKRLPMPPRINKIALVKILQHNLHYFWHDSQDNKFDSFYLLLTIFFIDDLLNDPNISENASGLLSEVKSLIELVKQTGLKLTTNENQVIINISDKCYKFSKAELSKFRELLNVEKESEGQTL